MLKRIGLILGALVLIGMGVMSPVQAQTTATQTSITISKNEVDASFPSSIHFTLHASAASEIDDVRLRYIVEQDSFVPIVAEAIPQFEPGQSVEASYEWDMRKAGGLPPGAVIEFWWTLETGGEATTTEPSRFVFSDDRYEWQGLESGKLNLYWYSGGVEFAQKLLVEAEEALLRLEEDTGVKLIQQVHIYIYESAQDMQQGMVFPSELAGGLAYPWQNTIALGINQVNFEWGVDALAHELAHLINYQMSRNPYNSIPTWLDEGIAMYASGELDSVYHFYLSEAVASDTLLSVRSLASPFSTQRDRFYLSYAQSYSLVQFLSLAYGPDKMAELLGCFQEGCTADEALQKVYGFDSDGLNSLWCQFVTELYSTPDTDSGTPLWAIAAIAGMSIGVVVVVFLIVRDTRRRQT